MKKSLFEAKESRAHYYAKVEVKKWIETDPELIGLTDIVKIIEEDQFCWNGFVCFVSDLGVYDKSGIIKFIEIRKTHEVDNNKILKMANYCIAHGWYGLEMIEISAEWVLNQCVHPEKIEVLNRVLISKPIDNEDLTNNLEF